MGKESQKGLDPLISEARVYRVSQNYVEGGGVRGSLDWGGEILQVNAALSAIGRYKGGIAAILSQIAVVNEWVTKGGVLWVLILLYLYDLPHPAKSRRGREEGDGWQKMP